MPGESGRTLTVAGTPKGLAEALETLAAWTADDEVPADTRRKVLTALDEVLSNIVRHGFRDAPGMMSVTERLEPGTLQVEVADTASPFDPMSLAPPRVDEPLERRRPGGLGVALVLALADRARYRREEGRNVFTLDWNVPETSRGLARGGGK